MKKILRELLYLVPGILLGAYVTALYDLAIGFFVFCMAYAHRFHKLFVELIKEDLFSKK